METNIYDCSLPLVAAKGGKAIRFIGTASIIGERLFATCAHVIQGLSEGESLGLYFPMDRAARQVTVYKAHKIYDFAIGYCEGLKKNFDLKLNPMTGMDVTAIGYTEEGGEHGKIAIAPRVLKGNIVRITEKGRNIDRPSNRICEVSFPSVSGFSGAPVFITGTQALVGMLYSNFESSVCVSSVEEVSVDGCRFKEKISRIQEFGLFHSGEDMFTWLKEMINNNEINIAQ